jgi:uncharacterized membrane protein SpoIIM required for sporulation
LHTAVALVDEHRRPVGRSVAALWAPLAAVTALFLVGFVAGWLAYSPPVSPDSLGAHPEVSWLVANNGGVALALALGGLVLGLTTVVGTVANAAILGGIVAQSLAVTSPGRVAALLAPHGVVEIPALLLAGAVGLALPWRLLAYLAKRRDRVLTVPELLDLVQVTALSLAMVAAAAVLESHLTPAVAG